MAADGWRSIPIQECGDALVAIPAEPFAFTEPHPYVVLGAPYAGTVPWLLRRRVVDALVDASRRLDVRQPGWRLKLFDAYRPLPVQAFMVWREFERQAALAGLSLVGFDGPDDLARRDPVGYARLAGIVFTFWGMPSEDARTPPPHSTGAAIDLTLQDASGCELDLGCPIDETTPRAYPNHFADAARPEERAIHTRRQLLNDVMGAAGFSRHTHEWWHFSLGDQMAAFAKGEPAAVFGRADDRRQAWVGRF